jgi:hypothetical protein
MRRLIRNRATRAFLKEDGSWTEAWHEAGDFSNETKLNEALRKFRPVNVELHYSFGREGVTIYDFVIPLTNVP